LEASVADHPHALDPASADEYLAGREIMAAAGLLAEPVRFAYYGLEEPPEEEVLAGGANQQWTAQNGALANPASGKCLDDPNGSTTNGTQLQIWSCSGASNQKWTLP
jgi:hypothetical protein